MTGVEAVDHVNVGPVGPVLAAEPLVTDARGVLWNLGSSPFGSILRIASDRGVIRGDHVHRRETHCCVLERGEAVYYWRLSGSTKEAQRVPMVPGRVVMSPPGVEHAFHFTRASVMYAISNQPRTRDSYEADTTRLAQPGLVPPVEARRVAPVTRPLRERRHYPKGSSDSDQWGGPLA